ncbi:hypothetical protein [Anthocerotibacter panamensis]|uniref:hypothetical protein n=1 Tax=Anthocerotibacter panamensis TaxID=2857077 RepID=UPI001C404315|nr:hypothetical protein [Anthocerotibacter panamensis]
MKRPYITALAAFALLSACALPLMAQEPSGSAPTDQPISPTDKPPYDQPAPTTPPPQPTDSYPGATTEPIPPEPAQPATPGVTLNLNPGSRYGALPLWLRPSTYVYGKEVRTQVGARGARFFSAEYNRMAQKEAKQAADEFAAADYSTDIFTCADNEVVEKNCQ